MESPTGIGQPQPLKEEISYPATRMMSIADLLEMNLIEPLQTRSFKTPAERKEMPPLPVDYSVNANPTTAEPAQNTTAILPAPINYGNTNFPASNIHYHINNMAPPYYDMHYYAGPPIAYAGLPQMTYNGGPPLPTYNPPVDRNVVLPKNPNYPPAEVYKPVAKKEKKVRPNAKRAAKFQPYEN